MGEFEYKGWTLDDAALALYAGVDSDSGVRDPDMQQAVRSCLDAMTENEYRLWLSRLIRDHFLTEDALAQGYGAEDAVSFIEWLATMTNKHQEGEVSP